MSEADWAHPEDEEMNTSKVTHLIHAFALAAFLSTFGTIGAAAQSAAQMENERGLAEQGYARAQHNVGVMYDKGYGVPQNHKLAAQWFRKAAEQGYDLAQNNLGGKYQTGEGVPQDYKLAVQWYRKAAEQGNAIAQHNLGIMYDNGQGVLQDYVQAHKWHSLAAAKHAKYRAGRDRLAKLMTPAQIAEAQNLAREWKPKAVNPKTSI
jgi:TPR repeat protein